MLSFMYTAVMVWFGVVCVHFHMINCGVHSFEFSYCIIKSKCWWLKLAEFREMYIVSLSLWQKQLNVFFGCLVSHFHSFHVHSFYNISFIMIVWWLAFFSVCLFHISYVISFKQFSISNIYSSWVHCVIACRLRNGCISLLNFVSLCMCVCVSDFESSLPFLLLCYGYECANILKFIFYYNRPYSDERKGKATDVPWQ